MNQPGRGPTACTTLPRSPNGPLLAMPYSCTRPNLPPESASKRPSPEALRCPSGQASVTKKRRSIYKESDRNVVRDRAGNCPCKNRVTVETAMTVRDGEAPHRPVSTFVPFQCFLMKSMSSLHRVCATAKVARRVSCGRPLGASAVFQPIELAPRCGP